MKTNNLEIELAENKFWEKIGEMYGEDFANYLRSKAQLTFSLQNAQSYYQKLTSLKTYYERNAEEILRTYKRSKHFWFTVYPTDWSELFTPIEFDAWCAIRSKGRIVLYPQFPSGNYFIDFANPGLKIGAELDGKDFHNKEKDKRRDWELKSQGWTIFRISGTEMCRTNYTTLSEIDLDETADQEINDKLSHWLFNTGDGIIEAIKEIYFEDVDELLLSEEASDWQYKYIELCHQTLNRHKSN